MISFSSLFASLPVFGWAFIVIAIVYGILVWYALRHKGDVSAELTHGKTTLRIDARDKRR
jgi:hypothetical protein